MDYKILSFDEHDHGQLCLFCVTSIQTSEYDSYFEKSLEAKITFDTVSQNYGMAYVAVIPYKDDYLPVSMVIAIYGNDNKLDKSGLRINNIYTVPKFRGHGIASGLLKKISKNNYCSATVRKKAIRLFERNGFTLGKKCKDGNYAMRKPDGYWTYNILVAVPKDLLSLPNNFLTRYS